ncbi:branched-chain amino acid ABC transporter permease [Rhodococcus opacus]|uniref:branched-chain amino acid ABC transporter permease n=1 Tax=Rhodococcus opacus TaxID=37919 RepID=UPI000EA9CC3C|nr:branched-chain amino acid ABC transporter permease [Rhodococcus opacus]QZS52718.1 branched-chain amino acid ABC transporter permease [Rhodococcus opacus]RKM65285.1 branched-chain amino acid ABC transporter permease [Rhodococcus opacus]
MNSLSSTQTQMPLDRRSRRIQPHRISVGARASLAVILVLAALPMLHIPVPVLLPGQLSSSGSLLILSIGLVFAGVAISFDVVFGYTGLLSAGHALVFALGIYTTNILMHAGLGYFSAAALAIVLSGLVNTALGAIALRVKAVAFTMVTLAFGEAFYILLLVDPVGIFGGEEGLPVAFKQIPDLLASARDVRWLYWLSLAFAVVAYLLAWMATRSRCGQVWQAIRENEDRVESLGLFSYRYKLVAFAFGGVIAAAGGAVYLLVARGANPSSASVHFSLALIVMVVLGGRGRIWGAAIGGIVYGILTLRLPELSTSGVLDGLPEWASRTVSEPLFVLGFLFILIVLFFPDGIVGLVDRTNSWIRTMRRKPKNKDAEVLPSANRSE